MQIENMEKAKGNNLIENDLQVYRELLNYNLMEQREKPRFDKEIYKIFKEVSKIETPEFKTFEEKSMLLAKIHSIFPKEINGILKEELNETVAKKKYWSFK